MTDENTSSASISQIEQAVERALRRILCNPKTLAEYWATGYAELEKHASDKVIKLIGRYIWNIVLTGAIAGMVTWVVTNGKI